MRYFSALLLLSTLALDGCVPVRIAVTPIVKGCVLDAESGQPVKNARISLRAAPKLLAIAGSDGCFSINETKEWTIMPLGAYDLNPVAAFLVEATDYESNTFGVYFGGGADTGRIVKLKVRASR